MYSRGTWCSSYCQGQGYAHAWDPDCADPTPRLRVLSARVPRAPAMVEAISSGSVMWVYISFPSYRGRGVSGGVVGGGQAQRRLLGRRGGDVGLQLTGWSGLVLAPSERQAAWMMHEAS